MWGWQVVAGTRAGPGGPAGYPTLKTLSLTAQLQQASVEVFGQGSRKESLILKVQVTQTQTPFLFWKLCMQC